MNWYNRYRWFLKCSVSTEFAHLNFYTSIHHFVTAEIPDLEIFQNKVKRNYSWYTVVSVGYVDN